MRRVIRKSLYTVLFLVFACVLVIVIGSQDAPTFDDKGLLDLIQEIPLEQNGYGDIAYTLEEGPTFFDDPEDEQLLKKHVYFEMWDKEFVERILGSKADHIASVRSSVDKSAFQFPQLFNDDPYDLPSYSPALYLVRLSLLESMAYAKSGDLDQSIASAALAVDFSQQIKTESSYMLISHMIGLAMQDESLNWVKRLATVYQLNSEQYDQLILVLDDIPSYQDDSFAAVFSGEFVYFTELTDQIKNLRGDWRETGENHDLDEKGFGRQLADQSLAFFQALATGYTYHKNRVFEAYAENLAYLASQASEYCQDQNFPELENQSLPLSWRDWITPNGLGRATVSMDQTAFKRYFTRRCLGHTEISVAKATVAIKKFQLEEGRLPAALDQLVPEYISAVPVDPFDGESIRYSANKRYIYSVGSNFQDDGGSLTSEYVWRCEYDSDCAENPTFPIY